MSSDILFRPFRLKGLNLPNRVVMAPMTRSFSPGGIPTEDVLAEMRASETPVSYLVGTPRGRLNQLEQTFLPRP